MKSIYITSSYWPRGIELRTGRLTPDQLERLSPNLFNEWDWRTSFYGWGEHQYELLTLMILLGSGLFAYLLFFRQEMADPTLSAPRQYVSFIALAVSLFLGARFGLFQNLFYGYISFRQGYGNTVSLILISITLSILAAILINAWTVRDTLPHQTHFKITYHSVTLSMLVVTIFNFFFLIQLFIFDFVD